MVFGCVLVVSTFEMKSVLFCRQFPRIFNQVLCARALHGLREPSYPVPNKYPKSVTNPCELFENLQSGQNVFIQGGAMTPTHLVKYLYNYAIDKDLTNIKTVHIHTEGDFPVNDEAVRNRFRSVSLFTGWFLFRPLYSLLF